VRDLTCVPSVAASLPTHLRFSVTRGGCTPRRRGRSVTVRSAGSWSAWCGCWITCGPCTAASYTSVRTVRWSFGSGTGSTGTYGAMTELSNSSVTTAVTGKMLRCRINRQSYQVF